MRHLTLFLIAMALLSCASCRETPSTNNENNSSNDSIGPEFNADSAYYFCEKQCSFGPRAMNSQAHDKCGEWIVAMFESFGCKVEQQKADLKGYDGTILHSTNIIAQWRPELQNRILLCAHWDTRPWADNDKNEQNHHKAIDGANDGASGVAVMLELARLIKNDTTLNIGIDFVCFDAEDWGPPLWTGLQMDNAWALGAQHWAENYKPNENENILFGILLDMVGGENAVFYKEGFSMKHAPRIVDKVWNAANSAGYSGYFTQELGGYITDDHIPVNTIAGIPTIDIIPHYPYDENSSFGSTWHTIDDNMQHIDRQTLKAVGQTIVQVLFTTDF